MTTARDLILGAYKSLGILGEGSTASAQMITDAVDVFNETIDSDNTDRLLLYQTQEESFSLTGAQSYTIGSGGAWNTTRPEHIERAWHRVDGIDYPVDIYTAERWAGLVQKELEEDWPEVLYYERSSPLGKIWVYPVATGRTLYFQSLKQLSEVDADTSIVIPPGYRMYYRAILAVRLAPLFNTDPSPIVVQDASRGMRRIKAANNRGRGASMCIEFARPSGGNILAGDR